MFRRNNNNNSSNTNSNNDNNNILPTTNTIINSWNPFKRNKQSKNPDEYVINMYN